MPNDLVLLPTLINSIINIVNGCAVASFLSQSLFSRTESSTFRSRTDKAIYINKKGMEFLPCCQAYLSVSTFVQPIFFWPRVFDLLLIGI
jgi:hypothetical protein